MATPCQSLEACLIDQFKEIDCRSVQNPSLLHRFFEVSGCREVLSLLRILGIKHDDKASAVDWTFRTAKWEEDLTKAIGVRVNIRTLELANVRRYCEESAVPLKRE